MSAAEVVIIGGGIMGCCAAYYMARDGLRVALFEKAQQVGQEASGVNAGGVRQHGRDPLEMPLAIEAIKMWGELERELEFDLEYKRGGHLRFATTQDEMTELENSVRDQRAMGLEDIEILDRRDVLSLVPRLSLEVLGASFCQSDGHANPHRVCPAFAQAAERYGAVIHLGTRVVSVGRIPDGSFRIETSAGETRAGIVVNAAGAWAGQVAAMLGARVPLEPRYWQSMVTEPVVPFLDPVLTWPHTSDSSGCWRNLNLKQLKPGQLLISGAWTGEGDLDSMRRSTVFEGVAGSARDFVRVFEHLDGIFLRRAWVGVDGHPPDNVIVMGAVPGIPGFLMAGPGSGHGFALGPIVGRLLGELIKTGRTSIPIDGLGPGRFPVQAAGHGGQGTQA